MSPQAHRAEPKRIGVAPRQRRVYAEGRAFAVAAERWMPVLRRVGRGLARGDRHLEDDMVQEALMELWAMDVTRFDAADDKVVRGVLIDRMRLTRMMERMEQGGSRRVYGNVEEMALAPDTDP